MKKGYYFEEESPMKNPYEKLFEEGLKANEGLNAWVEDEIDEDQKNKKQKAAKKILNCKLNNSESLDLSGLKLTSLPDQIFDLIQLKELHLEGNQLTSISGKIANFNKLKNLYFEKDRPIEDFPKIIELVEGLNAWVNEHDIDGKQKERREEAVEIILWCKSTNSKSLDLSGLKLTSLPDQIFDLTQLENLYLADNQLTSISNKVFDLRNLKELDYEKNPIPKPEIEEIEKFLRKNQERAKIKAELIKTCPTSEEIEDFLATKKPSCNFKPIKAEPTKPPLQEIGK